jgi:formate-dependent nitrite reductase cytochrome c552 subunit
LGKEHQPPTHREGAFVKEVYISVDIEAAGPVPAMYSMLSLGAAAVHDTQATFYVEVQPINDNALPEAMRVVDRTLQDFRQSGREPKQAMISFSDCCKQKGRQNAHPDG